MSDGHSTEQQQEEDTGITYAEMFLDILVPPHESSDHGNTSRINPEVAFVGGRDHGREDILDKW